MWVIQRTLNENERIKIVAESETGINIEGIQTIVDLEPHCVILILDIPELRAFEVARQFRELSNTKLILISVIDDSNYRDIANDIGVHNFFIASEASGKLLSAILEDNTN